MSGEAGLPVINAVCLVQFPCQALVPRVVWQCLMPKVHEWERKDSKTFPLALHAISQDDLKSNIQSWLQAVESEKVRVTKIGVTGPKGLPPRWANAWARCSCAKACKKTFRVDMEAEGEGSFCATWFQQGQHPEPAEQPEAQVRRKRAQSVAHMRPMQGQAHLLGDETVPQPSQKDVRRARREFLDQQRPSKRQRQDDGVEAWTAYLQQQAGLQKLPHQLVYTPVRMITDESVLQSLLIGEDVVVPEGACLLVSDHMLQVVSKLVKSGAQGAGLTLVSDWTYKLNVAGWGVGVLGLSQVHNARGDLPATEMIPAALQLAQKKISPPSPLLSQPSLSITRSEMLA